MLYNWKFWKHVFQSGETFTYVTLAIIQGRVKHQQAAAGEEDSFLRVGDKVVLMTWKWPGAPTLWAAPGWSTGLSGLRLRVLAPVDYCTQRRPYFQRQPGLLSALLGSSLGRDSAGLWPRGREWKWTCTNVLKSGEPPENTCLTQLL